MAMGVVQPRNGLARGGSLALLAAACAFALFTVGADAAAEVRSEGIFTQPSLEILAEKEGHLQAESEEEAAKAAAAEAVAEAARQGQAEGHEEGHEFPQEEAKEHEEEEEAEEAEEEVEFSTADLQVAAMLLGSVAFVMVLFYLVNYPDDDIRRYSWNIISTTISIFTAVLLFGGINQIIDKLIEPYPRWIIVCVHFAHCLFYLAAMQLTIATISGAMFEYQKVNLEEELWVINDGLRWDNGQVVVEDKVRTKSGKSSVMIDEENMEVPVQKRKVKKEARLQRMKCWATLTAHMGGFAAINAGGHLQHLEVFKKTPLMTFMPVIITLILIQAFFHLSKLFRDSQKGEALRAGRAGIRAKMCSEEVEEAENDVLSLSISFLTTQAVRYAISGVLPNVEGLEEPEHPHSEATVFGMYGIGAAFALGAFAFVFLVARFSGPVDEEGESSVCSRILSTTLQSLAMCFAWSLLFGTRYVHCWYRETMPIFNVETMMGRVVLALELSAFSMGCVFVLDVIDDTMKAASKGNAEEDTSRTSATALQTIINALGILVGFSWEHCFEAGVAAVASRTSHPETVKLGLGVMVVVVIAPAWMKYILTKAMKLEQLKVDRAKAMEGSSGKKYQQLGAVSDQRSSIDDLSTVADGNIYSEKRSRGYDSYEDSRQRGEYRQLDLREETRDRSRY